MAGQPAFRRALRRPPGPAGQGELEEPEEVQREGGQQERHPGQEERLLELDAPTDREPGALQGQSAQGQDQEGDQDARRRGEETQAHLRTGLAALGSDRQQFEGEHRQDAGHDVQDQAAEQREQQDREKPLTAALSVKTAKSTKSAQAAGRRFVAGEPGLLDAARCF